MSNYPAMDPTDWRWALENLQLESWWNVQKKEQDELHKNDYHGGFIPQIPRQMIQRFTQPYDVVLDPFLGHGTTGIEARRLGRHIFGCELNQEVLDTAQARIMAANKDVDIECQVAVLDCMELELEPEMVNLSVFHPPYGSIIKFNPDRPECLSSMEAPEFLRAMRLLGTRAYNWSVPDGHLVLVIGDCWDGQNRMYRPLAFETMNQLQCAGWKLRGILVKPVGETKGKGKDTNLWVSRVVKSGSFLFGHEYVMVFRKPNLTQRKKQ